MSDETELNPELEGLAASLRSVPAPKANIDRDQLMYDAGWAAAMTNGNANVSVGSRGLASLTMSFACGVAVAAAVLLSVVPFSGNQTSTVASSNITSKNPAATDATANSELLVASMADEATDQNDLLDWIENLPPGQSVNSGFSSSPSAATLASRSPNVGLTATSRPHRPKTSRQLLNELMPGASSQPTALTWSMWASPLTGQ